MADRTVSAFVLGRVGVDLYPQQLATPLEDVRGFDKFVGGFAGNLATGLARLGVSTAVISAVGDDGHGRFVRRFLKAEGVDVRWLGTHPSLRTALAFCEAWPPDHFPITFYRTPTCPDWELTTSDLPMELLAGAPLLFATGTGLAREPSRATTLAALAASKRGVFDLDWRPMLWEDAADYPGLVRRAVASSAILIGGAAEFEAAWLDPAEALSLGPELAVVKRGADGVSLVSPAGSHDVPGLRVPVVNGLGAGDAFAAGFGAALLAGLDPLEAARRGNGAGALVASRLACSEAMPTPDEIDALLAGAFA